MSHEEILRQIAYQESIQDQLLTELNELELLLRAAGFPQGVASVKEVAYQLLERESGF